MPPTLILAATLLLLCLGACASARSTPSNLLPNSTGGHVSAQEGEATYKVKTSYRGQKPGDVVPNYIAVDLKNPARLFCSESKRSAIYVWDQSVPGSTWEPYAGKLGQPGWKDGLRHIAQLGSPHGLCLGPEGHLFFLDHNHPLAPVTPVIPYVVLRRIDAHTGVVSTVAGSTSHPAAPVDGSGDEALFTTGSMELLCLPDGSLEISDTAGNGAIRTVVCKGDGCVPPSPGPDNPHGSGTSNAGWLGSWPGGFTLGALLSSAGTAVVMLYFAAIQRKVQAGIARYKQWRGSGEAGGDGAAASAGFGAPGDTGSGTRHLSSPLLPEAASSLADELGTAPQAGGEGELITAAQVGGEGSTDGSFVNLIDLEEPTGRPSSATAALL